MTSPPDMRGPRDHHPSNLVPLALPRAAAARPDHPAVVWCEGTISYRELAARAERTAAALSATYGDLAGERIVLALGNRPEFVTLVHAAQRLGAIVAPLNPGLTAGELAAQLGYVRPRVVVAEPRHLDHLRESLAESDQAGVPVVEPFETGADAPSPLHDSAATSDPLAIVFTSGTSARPRGVIVTHGNAAWSAAASALRLGHDPLDKWLAVLPLFHMGGLSILLRSAWYATTVVLEEGFDPAREVQMLRSEVTLASLVPTMLRRVLERWPEGSAADLAVAEADESDAAAIEAAVREPRLRAVLVGGGPLTAQLVIEARARGIPVCPTYGMTEATSQVATQVAWEPGDDPLAAPPMPFTSVRVVRDLADVAPGEEGDVLVGGPTVTPGYFGRPNATAAVFADGWLRTGDMGSLGADGRLRITGRRRDRIVTGGENVTPAEVEAVLETDDAVAEACVVGVPSDEWGMEVAAVLVAQPGASPETDAVLARARARLAAFKLPKRVVWVASLPRTASGKVKRGEVAVMLGAPPLPEEPPD